jgi:hypothetical protein
MKNVSKIFFLILLPFITINVTKAEECFVTNKENVQIPCDFYEGLRAYYSDNFLSYMTSAEYNQIKDNDLDDIETEVYTEGSNNRGTYIETSYKQLRITRNGNFINANLLWVQNPTIRSYDVFCIRFNGPTIIGTPLFREYYSFNGETHSSSNYSRKDFTNGFGVSVKLPIYNHLESDITFTYSGSGTIFASYQHATTNVSLTQSKKYTLSPNGYGSVLLFNSSIEPKYDNMPGVSIQG